MYTVYVPLAKHLGNLESRKSLYGHRKRLAINKTYMHAYTHTYTHYRKAFQL